MKALVLLFSAVHRALRGILDALGRLPTPAQLALPLLGFAAVLWLTAQGARASLLQLLEDDTKLASVFKQE